jgi:hypothetical protein
MPRFIALSAAIALIGCNPETVEDDFTVDPPGALTSTVEPGGIVMGPEGQSWSVSLQLSGVGRDGATDGVREGTVRVEGDRTVIDRGNIVEWYTVKGPAIEQGFDIAERPNGSGAFTIELAVGGDLRPWMGPDGVRFADDTNQVRAMYDSLVVVDANDTVLESRMDLVCDVDCVIELTYEDEEAVYPVVVDPLFYNTEQLLTVADLSGNALNADDPGWDIAIDGNLAVVGIPQGDFFNPFPFPGTTIPDIGSVAVLQFGSAWTQIATLAPATATSGALLGWSVDIQNGRVIAGAPGMDTVYVYDAPYVGPSDTILNPGTVGDNFGWDVAIDGDGDTAVVGAPNAPGGGANRGAAYVFDDPSTGFALTTTLNAVSPQNNDQFGYSVDIDAAGDTAVVGAIGDRDSGGQATGGVFVFEDAGGWGAPQVLRDNNLEGGALFGHSVSIGTGGIVVGAPGADLPIVGSPSVLDGGAAYVYVDNAGTWVFDQNLLSPVAEAGSSFGYAVEMGTDIVLVGQPEASSTFSAQPRGGKAWVFNEPPVGAGWVLDQELGAILEGASPAPLGPDELFGHALAFSSNGQVFVGAPDRANVSGAGIWVLSGFESDDDGDFFLSDLIDTDGDGLCGGIACDCNDSESSINPGATEDEIDDVDEDCDTYLANCNIANPSCINDIEIVISEFLADARSGEDEWIELHNYGTEAVDLAGFNLFGAGGGSHVIGNNDVGTRVDNLLVRPGDYVLLIRDDANVGQTVYNTEVIPGAGPVTAAQFYDDIVLPPIQAAGDDDLRLFSPTRVLDAVDYDASFSSGSSTPEGASFSVDPDFATRAGNNTPTHWCDGRFPFGTAGQFGTPGAVNDDCDYSYSVEIEYTGPSLPPINVCTTFNFDFDATSRFGFSGNGADFTFTRTTTDPGGQTTFVDYADFVGGGAGSDFTGSHAFGSDPTNLSGTIVPPSGSAYTAGTWFAIPGACP